MANHKIFASWTWNRRLPEPFDDVSVNIKSGTFLSKHNTEAKKTASLHAATLSAILQRMDLHLQPSDENTGAVGTQGDFLSIVEYPSKTGELQTVVFNRKNGRFIAGRYDDPSQPPKPYILKENEQSGSALFFALIDIALEDDEFMWNYNMLLDQKRDGFPNLNLAVQYAYILCDNLYRRVTKADTLGMAGIHLAIPSTGNIASFTAINLNKGVYNPDTALFGRFKVLTVQSKGKSKRAVIEHKDFISSYCLQERQLTAAETALVPKLPDWYVIPEEVVSICKHARETTKGNRPMRNFLLRGNAGTGKTEGAKAIAAGLGLPYMHLTCSANTEIFDILGQMMPVTDTHSHPAEYPTFEDIRMDAATAYFKLTGEYQEDITEDAVYTKLLEVIALDASRHTEEKQTFAFVESPLIEAMRKGYLLELQEPTVISNPGVLVGLNALLDACGAITLPTGERIERHPDTVVVITTNIGYEGCHSLNQSILSRMDLIIDMDEPDTDTLIQRVSRITGCKEKGKIKTMAGIVESIQQRCRMNMIDDGCCGVRELISWVQSYMICGDLLEAARYTILSSVSADAENRADIMSTCIDPVLNA